MMEKMKKTFLIISYVKSLNLEQTEKDIEDTLGGATSSMLRPFLIVHLQQSSSMNASVERKRRRRSNS